MGNLHLVTGYTGQPHVTAADHGSFFEALIRSGQFVMDAGAKFAASVVTNNQIRVSDGELFMQGRHVKLNPGTYVDLTIENGSQGYLRNDLIVARYTRDNETGIEECSLVVLKGTPAASNPSDPEHTIGNINAEGDLQHDFPLYRVPLSGLNVGELKAMFEPQKSLFDYANGAFAPSGYGLGGWAKIPTLTDIDNPPGNGWYYYNSGNIYACVRVTGYKSNAVVEEIYDYYNGYPEVKRRAKYTSVWGEWEWINPRMAVGVEYRTAELYKGTAVYKKVDTNGNILWRAENETSWHLLASADYVATATVE